ncbi:hypothetical protein HQQ81_12205 [Microbacteriaceae bacterium VKM Ac-2854]|nr:hypothetical protein [Microbacteriaceae bacterium VKM Ac-2854]
MYPESAVEQVWLIQQFFTAGLASRTIRQLLPCVDSGQASAEVFELLESERDRISAAMARGSELGSTFGEDPLERAAVEVDDLLRIRAQ